ncbi:glutathione S-transferase family protein [Acinetobacter silvestris]|uniref:Glutathione S-transferase n=1 Tax=Acinetobacter silvestris TaxID=1977882 RepID=A0A1Y3CB29_9GAMM|nr:glutathione S-transferase family protein [Acinetobacter silvestris]OTG64249.1 glutathione S-transferase [Acinetobacter silvestris]
MDLFIGNKNYSSWSMRAWLVLKNFDIPFQEYLIPFDDFQIDGAFKQKILSINPTGKVPVLKHDDLIVWDSLAICEYLAELYPDKKLWPQQVKSRARARSITAEMHSGFMALRSICPMNIEAELTTVGKKFWQESVQLQHDVQRIEALWNARPNIDGFLCGEDFTIADAFYAPIVMRFISYGIPLNDESQRYMQSILSNTATQQWIQEAKREHHLVECEEPYRTKY